ncbi:MAG: HAMP domain-containing histidine kinase [Lachnospiraceae bacterium]|nr:HAMP domain-containing histidine kinase [Lachnospiraceae bacterium]
MHRNRELRRYTIRYIAVTIIIGIIVGVVLFIFVRNLENIYISEYIKLPEVYNILKKYGYTDYSMFKYNDIVAECVNHFYFWFILLYLVFATCGYFLGFMLFRKTIRPFNELYDHSKKVLDDNEPIALSLSYDDEIGRFVDVYSKLVSAVYQGREDEKKQKEFLKQTIADISHQLKTPLSTLILNQELLSGELPDDKKKTILEKSGDQLDRMEWLIYSLLKLAKLEAGSITFKMKEAPIHSTICKAVENVRTIAGEKGVNIRLDCDEEMIISHDPMWLSEALTNIIKNAVEHSFEGGIVDIEVKDTHLTVTITIKDHGEGIAEGDIPYVFKRFYRSGDNMKENGIGIGLSLAKEIIAKQGGDIFVESVPGEYTCFSVVLLKPQIEAPK